MTLSTNPLVRYIPKRKMKCPTTRRRASIDGPPTHRRVSVDSARPSATSFQMHQQPQDRMPRRSSCPNLKKNVSFSQHCHVRVDRHDHDNLAAVEQWYSEEDHLRFKIDRTVDVKSFRKHAAKEVATSALCPVGIEQFLSSKGTEDAKTNRRLVIRTVLLEQTRQRAFGFRNPDQIASLAAQVSTESMKFAQKRGKFQEMSKFI